jgi:hypothetical protein
MATFTTFKSYIEAKEWQKASDDLLTTLWCKQVQLHVKLRPPRVSSPRNVRLLV